MLFDKLCIALLAIACCLGSTECSGSTGTDFSDQWWNAAEPGWGMTVHQQGDILFLGIMAYAADRTATWFTASAPLRGTDVQGNAVFAGDLYQNAGPPFDAPFVAAAVSARKVGTVTFDADGSDRANLTYIVDDVTVIKSIERQTWRLEDFTGGYLGAFEMDVNPLHGGCIGQRREELGPTTVAQTADGVFTLIIVAPARRCTYTGNYSQAGRMGTVQGNFSCTDDTNANVTLYEMRRDGNGITGRLQGTDGQCEYVGRFGGVAQ